MTYDPNNKWEVDAIDLAEECSFCDDQTRLFLISPVVLSTIRVLCKEIKKEWQILLKGEETKDGIYVTGYYIPKQEVTASTVTNNDDIDADFCKKHSIIGTCHSHSSMGVYFSNTDDEHTNMSFLKHHIVTNNDGKFKAISRVELPCGMTKFVDAIVQMEVPNVEKKDVEGIDNIEEKTYTTTYHAGGKYYGVQNAPLAWKRGNKRNHAFGYEQGETGYGW